MRIALASLLLVGCAASTPADGVEDNDDDSVGDGSGSGDDGSGSGSADDPEPSVVASGAYQVRSNIDLTVHALLPETAAHYMSTLADFHANPAKTLFDLAEAAGVPAVATIRDNLPAYVEDKLEGWINGEIEKLTINGVPVRTLAGEVVTLTETALTQFAIDSELTVGGGNATHTLKMIDFNPAGIAATFAVEAFPADIISATPTCSTADKSMSIGDHGFAIHYGEYTWRALEAAHVATYGMTIRDALGAAMNCPALATVISQKCYWGYCVGHQTELTTICERGLDEAVERAHAKVAELRFDALHLASGTAELVDADNNLVAEALASGIWSAELNAGMGLRTVPATFTAAK